MTNRFKDITQAVPNNSILDPFQGYDADVWAVDQATGNWVLVGRFTSIELVFRNTTRPYIEFNQRVMRQLDGNFMIGWTMERGQLDSRVLQQTFGYSKISRSLRINRHPRMQIVFQINSPDIGGPDAQNEDYTFSANTGESSSNLADGVTSGSKVNFTGVDESDPSQNFNNRHTKSIVALTFCKVETFTLRAEAGDEVISNRWEGVAEGYEVIDASSVWAGHYLEDSGASNASSIIGNLQTPSNLVGEDTNDDSRKPFTDTTT